MSLWSRLTNALRPGRLEGDLEEEMQSHLAEAAQQGRDPQEARRAFGPQLQQREHSRDLKIAAWLDSLRADTVFSWRQILKNKAVFGAAILSLALATGACTAAFRLVDALLLRPLPVAHPERLYTYAYQEEDAKGSKDIGDGCSYPLFRRLREAGKADAQVMAISYPGRADLTYGSDQEMEKTLRQFVSGNTFDVFGLRPALGRLLGAADDVKPGAHPVAVISHDYWVRRFGGDPSAIGRKFRLGLDSFEIVGVLEPGFTGTEPGAFVDLFLPTMMNAKAIDEPGWSWFRAWASLRPGVSPERVREKFQATLRNFRAERIRGRANLSKRQAESYVGAPVILQPAAAGVSGMQKRYRQALLILATLVLLLLLIACANVANLMTAHAAARAKEMALRVSIGAGRRRLLQLVLVESLMVALSASALGALFAWWAAPFIVGQINPPDNPARLILPADWRVLGFLVSLTGAVTVLFGLTPALRASAVKPMAAIRGGEDPHARRRLMNALVAAQVAFCFLVHFAAGLFAGTFHQLTTQPLGFAPERVLVMSTAAQQEQPPPAWQQVVDHLRTVPGVDRAALAGWGLMSGSGWSQPIFVDGRLIEDEDPYFLGVSPGWLDTMRVGLIGGRDFRPEDRQPNVAIVNEVFARAFFAGQSPIGKVIEAARGNNTRVKLTIVGYVRDARCRNLRERIRPTLYVPFFDTKENGSEKSLAGGTFIVRTRSENPLALAATLRQEVARVHSGFRVSSIAAQTQLIEDQTIRERLLAMLSAFFAAVALTLAGVGLFGVLHYAVHQRRREIGIRLALGASTGDVAWRITAEVFAMLILGSAVGLALGLASRTQLEPLLYGVKPTDWSALTLPLATLAAVAVVAALAPVLRAVRIDPARTLRAE